MIRPTLPLIALFTVALPALAQAQSEAELRARIAQLENQIASQRAEIAQLRQTIAQQQKLLNTRDADMARQLEQAKAEAARAKAVAAQATEKATELQKQEREQVQQRQAMYVSREQVGGKTELSTRPMPLTPTRGTRAKHWIDASTSYAGETIGNANTTVQLGVQTQYSGDTHKNTRTLTFNADDKTIVAKRTDYDRLRRMTGSAKNRTDKSDEFLTFTVSAADVQALAKAVNVTGKIGYVEFNMPRATQEGLQAFAQAMTLGQ